MRIRTWITLKSQNNLLKSVLYYSHLHSDFKSSWMQISSQWHRLGRLYITLQSSDRTEGWEYKKEENSEEPWPHGLSSWICRHFLKTLFPLWLNEDWLAGFPCTGLKEGIAVGKQHEGDGSCSFHFAFFCRDFIRSFFCTARFFHPECCKSVLKT